MDPDERKILSILSNTNKTLFDAQKSNSHRIGAIKELMQDTRLERLEHTSIRSLDSSLTELRDEIYYMLTFSREYMDVLAKIDAVNLYDAAEIIVEIEDVRRFKNLKHFLSYAGLAPVVKKGKYYSKVKKYQTGDVVANKKQDPIDYCENLKVVLMRCAKKLIRQDPQYKTMYHLYFRDYKYKHPTYKHKRLELMALKKVSVKFATFIYREFLKIAKYEEEENET